MLEPERLKRTHPTVTKRDGHGCPRVVGQLGLVFATEQGASGRKSSMFSELIWDRRFRWRIEFKRFSLVLAERSRDSHIKDFIHGKSICNRRHIPCETTTLTL